MPRSWTGTCSCSAAKLGKITFLNFKTLTECLAKEITNRAVVHTPRLQAVLHRVD